MALYTFTPFLVLDAQGEPADGAAGQIYALSDTSFETPLEVTDLNGLPLSLTTSADGIVPAFRVEHTEPSVVWKSGDAPTSPMISIEGVVAVAADAAEARSIAEGAADGIAEASATANEAHDLAASADAAAALVNGKADAAVATAAAAQADATSALNASSASTVRSARVVTDGDSITIGGVASNILGSGTQDKGRAWPSFMEAAARGRLDLVHNAAIGGHRSDNRLAAFDTAVAPYSPDTVILTVGTNDLGQGRDMNLWLADLEAYRVKVSGIGARLVVGAIYPTASNDPAGRSALVPVWNAALRAWARTAGVRVIPFDSFTDPATGGWPAGWSPDLIHPTDLDAPMQIGVLAWESIADLFDGQTIGTADWMGSGSLTNGLFTASITTGAPGALVATPSTSAGSLAAGTYSYRMTTRSYLGESALSAHALATLAATGQVVITGSAVANNRGYRVYRRGPNDLDWLYIGNAAPGTIAFTDDGTATPGARATGVDTSAMPTGADPAVGNTTHLGGGLLDEPEVKGKVLRLRTREDTGGEQGFLLNGAASVPGAMLPGETWELTGLVRGDGRNTAVARLRLQSGSTSVTHVLAYYGVPLPGARWGRFHLRVTVPASGVDNARPILTIQSKIGAEEGYVDFAEVRLVKVG